MVYLGPAGPHIPDTGYGEAPAGSPMARYRAYIRDMGEAIKRQHEAEWAGVAVTRMQRPVMKPGDELDPVLAYHLRRDKY